MLTIFMIFLKHKIGRDTVISNQIVLNELALNSYSSIPEVKKTVYDIFSFLCASEPSNYPIVLTALDNVSFKMKEKLRFEHIVSALRHETKAETKTSALTLINCIINTPENLFDRIAARNEFIRLGIEEILSSESFLSNLEGDDSLEKLRTQINVFFSDVKHDEDEYNDEIENLNDGLKSIPIQDPDEVYKALYHRVMDKPYIKNPFINILQRLLLLDMDKDKGHKEWLFVEKILHQLAAKKNEIQLDQDVKISSDDLQLDMEAQSNYENQIQSQLLKISRLEEKVDYLSMKYEDAQALERDMKNLLANKEREVREELKIKMNNNIDEAIIIKKKKNLMKKKIS